MVRFDVTRTASVLSLSLIMALGVMSVPLGLMGAESDESQRRQDETVIRALLRLDNVDLDESPQLKKTVLRYLRNNQGTDRFLDIIERFDIREMNEALWETALNNPNDTRGVRAVRILLEYGEKKRIRKTLNKGEPKEVGRALSVLGFTGRMQAMELVTNVMLDDGRSKAIRSEAVQAFGHNRAGEEWLLKLAKNGRLPEALEFQAAQVLQASQDARIREQVPKHLNLPSSADDDPLPPISELVKRSGDPRNGKKVFQRACTACHQVNSKGVNFGPDLSEIGSKLAKEELYLSILDPSAAITHGYRGYRIKTQSGAEYLGYIVSETKKELILRMQGGIDQTIAKSKITSREPMDRSLMIPGLQRTMSEEELVDLVEYLTTLKKPNR